MEWARQKEALEERKREMQIARRYLKSGASSRADKEMEGRKEGRKERGGERDIGGEVEHAGEREDGAARERQLRAETRRRKERAEEERRREESRQEEERREMVKKRRETQLRDYENIRTHAGELAPVNRGHAKAETAGSRAAARGRGGTFGGVGGAGVQQAGAGGESEGAGGRERVEYQGVTEGRVGMGACVGSKVPAPTTIDKPWRAAGVVGRIRSAVAGGGGRGERSDIDTRRGRGKEVELGRWGAGAGGGVMDSLDLAAGGGVVLPKIASKGKGGGGGRGRGGGGGVGEGWGEGRVAEAKRKDAKRVLAWGIGDVGYLRDDFDGSQGRHGGKGEGREGRGGNEGREVLLEMMCGVKRDGSKGRACEDGIQDVKGDGRGRAEVMRGDLVTDSLATFMADEAASAREVASERGGASEGRGASTRRVASARQGASARGDARRCQEAPRTPPRRVAGRERHGEGHDFASPSSPSAHRSPQMAILDDVEAGINRSLARLEARLKVLRPPIAPDFLP